MFILSANVTADAAVGSPETNAFEPVIAIWAKLSDWIALRQEDLIWFVIGIACSVIVALVATWVINGISCLLIRKSETGKMLVRAINRPLITALTASGIVISMHFLKLSANVFSVVRAVYFLVITMCVAVFLLKMVDIWRNFMIKFTDRTATKFDDLLVGLLSPAFKAVIWVIAVLFIAENVFKFNITAMLTGAGIAAMAIAFAAQNTIANIFGAISLIIDRPFQIGDLIIVNGKRGEVVNIGLRSTAIRSLDGTVWVIPNKEMSEASIENITRRPNIKHVFDIGIVYSSSPEVVKRATEIIREILVAHPLTDNVNCPPIVYFESLKDWSLNIQAIQWFQTCDFKEYCIARDEVNSEILKRFNAENISFAFPTQSLYIEKGE